MHKKRPKESELMLWVRLGKNEVKYVKVKIPLAYVIGDGKSADMLSGRFGGYNL